MTAATAAGGLTVAGSAIGQVILGAKFTDNFSTYTPSAYLPAPWVSPSRAIWVAGAGGYLQPSPGSQAFSYLPVAQYGIDPLNYTWSITANLGSVGFILWWGINPAIGHGYYLLILPNGSWQAIRFADFTLMASGVAGSLTTTGLHLYTLTRQGSAMTASQDGTQFCSFTDSTYTDSIGPMIEQGSGSETYGDWNMRNFSASSLTTPSPAVAGPMTVAASANAAAPSTSAALISVASTSAASAQAAALGLLTFIGSLLAAALTQCNGALTVASAATESRAAYPGLATSTTLAALATSNETTGTATMH